MKQGSQSALPVAVFCWGLAVQALAQYDTWTTHGPLVAAHVGALSLDPGGLVLYAIAYPSAGTGGLLRSATGGAGWEGPALTTESLLTLAAAAGGIAYAGTQGGRVYKTTDAGASWRLIVDEPGTAAVLLRADPVNPLVAYRTMLSTTAPGGTFPPLGDVLRTTDGGATWVSIKTGLNAPPGSLATDPQHSGVLYAAAATGFFVSTTFGSNWSSLPNGLSTQVTELLVDPVASATLYAGTTTGVLKSTDGGATFAPASAGLPTARVTGLAADAAHPGRVFVGLRGSGVFMSLDRASSWTALNTGLANLGVNAIAIDGHGTVLHAGTDAGAFDLQFAGSVTEALAGIIPVAITAPGASGSFFRTSAQLRNPLDPSPGQVKPPIVGRIVFHPAGVVGTLGDPSLPFVIGAGSVIAIADVLSTMGQAGLGSLDVLTTSGPAPVGVLRVFNDVGAAGTYGFAEDVFSPSDGLNAGDRAILFAPPDFTLFRWNIGIRTLAITAVTLTVHNAQGTLTRTATRLFGPNVMLQATADAFIVDDAHPGPQPSLGGNDSLTIQVTAGNAFLYGAIVDNRTNDPNFQVARRLP